MRERGKEKVGEKEKVEREREGREGKGIGAGGEKGRGCEGGRDSIQGGPEGRRVVAGTMAREVEWVLQRHFPTRVWNANFFFCRSRLRSFQEARLAQEQLPYNFLHDASIWSNRDGARE